MTTLPNEMGFVVGSVVLGALVAVTFALRMTTLGNDTCNTSSLKSVSRSVSVLASSLFDDRKFEGRNRRVRRAEEQLEVVSGDDTEKQRVLISIEKAFHRSPTHVQVVSEMGDVLLDSRHSESGSLTERPLARISDQEMLDSIVRAASVGEDGSFLKDGLLNTPVYCRKLPSYPSYILVLSHDS